jgi:hypothetical protein
VHDAPVAHRRPQAPQLLASVASIVQVGTPPGLQIVAPIGQAPHAPDTQLAPTGQTLAQLPQ